LEVRGERKRVAIACQGGGSHTAFTAGVLKRFLHAEELEGHEVVGLSGTSGGAVCALLAWHHLLRGDGAGAADALDAFWRDNSATRTDHQPLDRLGEQSPKLRHNARGQTLRQLLLRLGARGVHELSSGVGHARITQHEIHPGDLKHLVEDWAALVIPNRRMSKDYERLCATSEAFLQD
jgi:predicted acylesterase/phospholipase RssA